MYATTSPTTTVPRLQDVQELRRAPAEGRGDRVITVSRIAVRGPRCAVYRVLKFRQISIFDIHRSASSDVVYGTRPPLAGLKHLDCTRLPWSPTHDCHSEFAAQVGARDVDRRALGFSMLRSGHFRARRSAAPLKRHALSASILRSKWPFSDNQHRISALEGARPR